MAAAPAAAIDRLDAETFSPLGEAPLVVLDPARPDAAAEAARLTGQTQAILIGVDHAGACPEVDAAAFDCLLSARADAPAPWVGIERARLGGAVEGVRAAVAAAPVAAAVLARVLRINAGLALRDALAVESLAYSTLLGGAAFRAWLSRRPPPAAVPAVDGYVTVAREDDLVTIALARPDTRNAMGAGMRDALFEALAAVADDPTRPRLVLRGEGACFSVGGDLAEFGSARDLAAAHAVRTARSCAALLAALGERAEVRLHGACIGAGLEVPAAASRRVATPGAFFQLPELAMGLIPGAGGTATVARAIGRHRTCWMALSGRRVTARTALRWGLVHAIEAA